MKWFDENELPKITNQDELELAMGAVKSRFNGHPHTFTRNDYLLFINTLYAALISAYNNIGTFAELKSDILPNYPIEVGYINNNTRYETGTKLEKILKDMLVGNPETYPLHEPIINYSTVGSSAIVTINTQESNCDIYYSLNSEHGWRIYNGQFTVFNNVDILAKAVPNYRSGYYRTESDIVTKKILLISNKLTSPIITVVPQYTKCDVMLSSPELIPGDGIVLYSTDNKNWIDYSDKLIYNTINNIPYIYARIKSLNENYLDSDTVLDQVSYKSIPNPMVIFTDTTKTSKSYTTNGTFYYCGLLILDGIIHDSSIKDYKLEFRWNNEPTIPDSFGNTAFILSCIKMDDGKTYNISSGINIKFEQYYLSSKSALISGTNDFEEPVTITVSKNLGKQGPYGISADDFVDLQIYKDGIELKENTFTVNDTVKVVAYINIKPEFKLCYLEYDEGTSINETFNKKLPLLIYSTMLDPVGLSYTVDLGNDSWGIPITEDISINKVGDPFKVTGFDSSIEYTGSYQQNKSNYFVKLSKDLNPYIYFSRELNKNSINLIEKDPESASWDVTTLGASNIADKLELLSTYQEIDGNLYYVYKLNINKDSACLYKLEL